MFIRQVGDTRKLCYYRYSKDLQQLKYNIDHNIIDNLMLLVIGKTGSGKTVLANNLASDLFSKGYSVIYVTEKQGNELDNANCIFQAYMNYHINKLKKHKIEPSIRKVLFYHPITLEKDYKDRYIFPFNKAGIPYQLYSFSLNNIRESSYCALLSADKDMQVIRICLKNSKMLQNNENLWDFLNKVHLDINKKENKFFYDPERFNIPTKSLGDKRDSAHIIDSFSAFKQIMVLQMQDSKYNIDMANLLNDNENFHFFSLKYIKNERIRYFIIIQLLEEIANALDSGVVKNPVCIVLEEIKILLPDETQVTYEKELAKLILKLLARIRTKAYVIGTTQDYYATNRDVRGAFNCRLIGKISSEDRARMIKYEQFPTNVIKTINSLGTGQFVLWEWSLDTEDAEKIDADVPPFANAEQGEDFLKKYKQYYPDKLKDYKQELDEFITIQKESDEKIKKYWKEQEKIYNEVQKEKEKEKQQKLVVKKDDKKESMRKLIHKQVLQHRKKNPDISWNKLGELLGRNPKTVKTYFFSVEKENVDAERCSECDGLLVEKQGKFGAFLGCENFPECKFTKKSE